MRFPGFSTPQEKAQLQADIIRLEAECRINVSGDEGWVAAYARTRHGIVIYRHRDTGAWLVCDATNGEKREVANTTEARSAANEMIANKM